MPFVDTHTHLYLPEFKQDSEATVERAINAGVDKLIFPNIDVSTIATMNELQKKYPNNIYMAMGLHPTSVDNNWKNEIATIKSELDSGEYNAIGETGLDFYWDTTYKKEQLDSFEEQLKFAQEYNLPIIIHNREALNETLEIMENYQEIKSIFHSFGGTPDDVKNIRKKVGDPYFGISGIVTFKNSTLKDSLSEISLERIILETDSPYLTPVPYRGKRCESSYILYIARFISDHMNIPLFHVEETTTDSAINLFKL